MLDCLDKSYQYCRYIARTRANNFYYSFLLLPKDKRDAMCAIYAFMRYCDDAVDDCIEYSEQETALEQCRSDLDYALCGEYRNNPIFPALYQSIKKYEIPQLYFYDLIDGMKMDLNITRYQTFDELYQYCYKAASVVGLVSIYVFGFKDMNAIKYAEYCGIAFQLTNIIRDIKEDYHRGRIYLPQEDLIRFHCTESDLINGNMSTELCNLLEFEVNRTQDYYTRSLPLISLINNDARPCLITMQKIYNGLLFEIRNQNYDVFNKRIRLPVWKKLLIAGQAWLKNC